MIKRISLLLWLYTILILLVSPAALAKEVRIAVFPFTVHSQEDIAYIQEGIASLLPSRIAVSGKIGIVDSYAIRDELKKLPADHPLSSEVAIGKKLKADFILIGNITKIGSNVSLDTRLIEAAPPEQETPLFIQSLGLNDMLPQLTAFAEKVKKRVLGSSEPIESVSDALPQKEETASSTPRPVARKPSAARSSKAAQAEDELSGEPAEDSGDTEGETIERPRMEKKPPLFESTPFYSTTITGETLHCMTAGDMEGDGTSELLMSGEHSILVYQWREGGLQLRDQIQADFSEHVIHIDSGDTNKNGRDEIFVSSFEVRAPNSYVLELKDSTYKKIEKRQDSFFRIYQPPGKRPLILGQKAGEANLFANTIFTFAWKNDRLLSRNEFLIPESLHIYGFVQGDIDGDNRLEYIAFDKGIIGLRYQLTIFSSLGRTRWRDTQNMGGEVNCFVKRIFGNDIEQKEYIPMRILCDDFNKDGRLDVIVGRNAKKSRLSRYNQGEVFCLHWDGSDLIPNWSSGLADGYVTDYGVFDLDRDGKKELYILSISDKGFLGKEKTRLTVFKQSSPQ